MTSISNGQKTFILGLGAQKAGTTWYFNYLASSGLVAEHLIKEYHIWDALHIPGFEGERVTKAESESSFRNRVRFFLQQSPENYFAYFVYMMQAQARSVTCDVTPIYSGLGRDILKLIRDGFAQRNVATKAVFLMRDPVERCWSAVRMESRNEQGHTRIDEDAVVDHALSRLAGLRSRYDITVGEIEATFAVSSVYLGIYEEMFEPPNLERLSAFSGVPTRPEHAVRKFNVSEVAEPISEKAAARIAAHYRNVYEFAAKRFPQTLNLWRGFKYL